MAADPDPSQHFWISSQLSNKSHDLRLLNILSSAQYLPKELSSMLKKLKYEERFGTPEMANGFPRAIQNVHDAALTLGNIISSPSAIASNEALYRGKTKLGDLHINCAKDSTSMRFEKF